MACNRNFIALFDLYAVNKKSFFTAFIIQTSGINKNMMFLI